MNNSTLEFKKFVRGTGTVRKRCLEFIQAAKSEGYEIEMPLEEAKLLFQVAMGIVDRTSLKAYFGTRKGKTVRTVMKTARYQSGTTSLKAIELTENVPERKGYFEILRLATYEFRGSMWFMVFNESSIVPQFQHREYMNNSLSMGNFSLSLIQQPIHSQHLSAGTIEGRGEKESMASPQQPTVRGEREERESYSVRERNRSSESTQKRVASLETADRASFAEIGKNGSCISDMLTKRLGVTKSTESIQCTCSYCGKKFKAKRDTVKFCSVKCRMTFYREKVFKDRYGLTACEEAVFSAKPCDEPDRSCIHSHKEISRIVEFEESKKCRIGRVKN